jgi:hypothetical protein
VTIRRYPLSSIAQYCGIALVKPFSLPLTARHFSVLRAEGYEAV